MVDECEVRSRGEDRQVISPPSVMDVYCPPHCWNTEPSI